MQYLCLQDHILLLIWKKAYENNGEILFILILLPLSLEGNIYN